MPSESEVGQALVEALANAQMKGYVAGVEKGILLAEHATGTDLTYLRDAWTEASEDEGKT